MDFNPIRIFKKIKKIPERIRNLENDSRQLKDYVHEVELENKYLRNCILPESEYPHALSEFYFRQTGEYLNLNNPQTYNEKIQWFKLYGITPEITRLADKYRVREYVTERGCEQYLIPLLGAWKYPTEIDISILPDSFVLKANHGCGYNYIVKDKNCLDENVLISIAWKWLQENYAFRSFEMQYRNIPRCLIAEEFLEGDKGEEISDYKFMCFDGNPRFFWIDFDRYNNHKRNIYDMDFNQLNLRINYENANVDVKKPKNWEEMVWVVKKLSAGFSHVRVDLYNVKGRIYFGELTFTTESGLARFYPKLFNNELGSMWNLK